MARRPAPGAALQSRGGGRGGARAAGLAAPPRCPYARASSAGPSASGRASPFPATRRRRLPPASRAPPGRGPTPAGFVGPERTPLGMWAPVHAFWARRGGPVRVQKEDFQGRGLSGEAFSQGRASRTLPVGEPRLNPTTPGGGEGTGARRERGGGQAGTPPFTASL